jgi:hypothetical protein
MNKWIWGDKNMSYRFPKYAPFMKKEEQELLARNNFQNYFLSLSVLLKDNIIRIKNNDYYFSNKIGGYLWLERNKTDSLIANIKNNHKPNNSPSISNKNIEYLNKIVRLCKKEKVNIFLVRSPQHKLYSGRINEDYFRNIKDSLFKEIVFLDFNNFSLNNSEFGDLEHLNHYGAKVFSLWFNKLLKDNLLNKEDKKEFIEIEMRKYERTTKYKNNSRSSSK